MHLVPPPSVMRLPPVIGRSWNTSTTNETITGPHNHSLSFPIVITALEVAILLLFLGFVCYQCCKQDGRSRLQSPTNRCRATQDHRAGHAQNNVSCWATSRNVSQNGSQNGFEMVSVQGTTTAQNAGQLHSEDLDRKSILVNTRFSINSSNTDPKEDIPAKFKPPRNWI
jgi:hypothetical protein